SYTPGATRTVAPPRRPARESRPRPVVRRPARATPPERGHRLWIPVVLGALVVSAAVAILLVSGARERTRREEAAEPEATGGSPARVEPVPAVPATVPPAKTRPEPPPAPVARAPAVPAAHPVKHPVHPPAPGPGLPPAT